MGKCNLYRGDRQLGIALSWRGKVKRIRSIFLGYDVSSRSTLSTIAWNLPSCAHPQSSSSFFILFFLRFLYFHVNPTTPFYRYMLGLPSFSSNLSLVLCLLLLDQRLGAICVMACVLTPRVALYFFSYSSPAREETLPRIYRLSVITINNVSDDRRPTLYVYVSRYFTVGLSRKIIRKFFLSIPSRNLIFFPWHNMGSLARGSAGRRYR